MVLLLFVAQGAQAQDPAANDPSATSPPGTVYQLPLDTARADAAPRRPPGSSGGEAGGGTSPGRGVGSGGPVSSIRSENGFGSSSTVPGTAPSADAGSDAGDGGGSGGGDGDAGSAGASGGDAGGDTPNAARAPDTATPQAAAAEQPSQTTVYALLALALVIGAVIGVVSRASRRPAAHRSLPPPRL